MGVIKWLEFATMVFGLFCVGLSIVLSHRFSKVKNERLANALTWQLLVEAFIGFVTVLFAITSWLNIYSKLAPEIVLIMRICIFSAGSISSINLYRKVKELE